MQAERLRQEPKAGVLDERRKCEFRTNSARQLLKGSFERSETAKGFNVERWPSG